MGTDLTKNWPRKISNMGRRDKASHFIDRNDIFFKPLQVIGTRSQSVGKGLSLAFFFRLDSVGFLF